MLRGVVDPGRAGRGVVDSSAMEIAPKLLALRIRLLVIRSSTQ
jgi:hypothetical protein